MKIVNKKNIKYDIAVKSQQYPYNESLLNLCILLSKRWQLLKNHPTITNLILYM